MSDQPRHHQKDAALESFMQYVREQDIQVHHSIKPYSSPGRGSGIYAVDPLKVCSSTSFCSFLDLLLFHANGPS